MVNVQNFHLVRQICRHVHEKKQIKVPLCLPQRPASHVTEGQRTSMAVGFKWIKGDYNTLLDAYRTFLKFKDLITSGCVFIKSLNWDKASAAEIRSDGSSRVI